MRLPRAARNVVVAAMSVALRPALARGACAQSMTTAAISGVVSVSDGNDIESAVVEVLNRTTGVVMRSVVHRGRYTVQGLEVGGPYSLSVRRIGYAPQSRDIPSLQLGQERHEDFVLAPLAATLPAAVVKAEANAIFSPSRAGVGSTISDSALHRLPTANRDLYDFVQLAPQVSTRTGLPVSGGGVNPRFDSFVIDGASEQALQGNNPAGFGKSISLEAVKEYQVLLSPYDVRNGSFAGALVNAVTRNGTNDFHGSAFSYVRNETLARNVDFLRAAPFERSQFGFSVGGPIIHNRVHFFVSPEFQRLNAPASGPYVGQSASSATPVPVNTVDVARLNDILRKYGLEGGSAGPVGTRNPTVNLFGRLDVALPEWNSRLVLRHNYSQWIEARFSRPIPPPPVFPLSTYGLTQDATKNATVAQLYTTFASGASNELFVGRTSFPVGWTPNVRQPLVYITVPRADTSGNAFIQTGSFLSFPDIRQTSLEVTDNFTVNLGAAHRLTLGGKAEFHVYQRSGLVDAYGVWGFASLEALGRGVADSFRVNRDFGADRARLRAAQYGIYGSDQWQVSRRLAATLGLRVDVPSMMNAAPYEPAVDSLFGRRTDVVPSAGVYWSPRAGFNWDVTGDQRNQLRGGAGLFVGRPPFGWYLDALRNYGSGIRTLKCGLRQAQGDLGLPPPFVADYRTPPDTCLNGVGFEANVGGAVNLLQQNLRYPTVFRSSLGYDRQLPWGIVATAEGLYTRNVDDFLFVNLNLRDPVGVDRHGRVMYNTIGPSGRATPNVVTNRFTEVIDVRNQSKNYSYSLTGQLQKRFSNRLDLMAAYTWSRVRDVQTDDDPVFLNNNWRFGRAISTRHDALDVGISDNDQPHRVVLVGTYAAPWRRWRTDFSLYYVGGSGLPYTYTAAAGPGKGDLNGDGTNTNDPIYVPRSSFDTAEIHFTGTPDSVALQRSAFEAFVNGTACLRERRGRILARNSCRSPWVHTANVAIRQSLPSVRGHTLSLELELFNALNLLNSKWGWHEVPHNFPKPEALLEQVGQTPGSVTESQPIFRFDPATPRFTAENRESYYQLQVAIRVTF